MDNLIFVTNTDRHNVSYPTYSSVTAKFLIQQLLLKIDRVQLDFETTGLDPYLHKLLLCSININNNIYVVDLTIVKLTDILTIEDLQDKLVIAHNAKFEYKFAKTNGLQLNRLYCTMIAEQRLIMGTGYSANLVETCKRRGVDIPEGMDKDVRDTFIGADVSSIIFDDEQILYSASDVIPLEDIMNKQLIKVDSYNMQHLIHNIEMPLINILADCELQGWRFNSDMWLQYAKEGREKIDIIIKELDQQAKDYGVKLETINPDIIKKTISKVSKLKRIEDRMDKLVNKLHDFEKKEKTHLKAYSITQDAYDKCTVDLSLLLNTNDEDDYIGINWSSSDQVIKVFEAIGIPLPMDKDKKTKQQKPSMSKEARSLWYSDNEDSIYLPFFKLYDPYKKTIHNINAFGEEWVNKYVRDGRVYCYYKQCNTDTGRLASGDANNGYPNIQQIPSIKELRSSFIADEGYELVTCDLSGAELTIMCSLADDTELWALSESDDIHSPIATASWRKVYAHRGDIELAESFLITKDINSDLRRKFKNLTFGSVYGCHATKAATTVGVSKAEGQIILDGIKESIPRTFNMVEESTKQAYRQGYLVSDTRSNSRKWFLPILENRELEFMERVAIDGQSRNFKIQSCQASMVKESIVVIDKFNKDNNLDVQLRGTVHDECIYQYPIGLEVTYKGEQIPYAEYVARAMKDTANLYLQGQYLMKADYHVNFFWEK